MRKLMVLLSCCVGVFLLGIGTVLFLSDEAMAVYCDEYAPAPYLYQSDIPCTTSSGASGTWLLKCEGWLYFNGYVYECACSYYRCTVPERPPEEIPYQEP